MMDLVDYSCSKRIGLLYVILAPPGHHYKLDERTMDTVRGFGKGICWWDGTDVAAG